jgi:hypothetical protein
MTVPCRYPWFDQGDGRGCQRDDCPRHGSEGQNGGTHD